VLHLVTAVLCLFLHSLFLSFFSVSQLSRIILHFPTSNFFYLIPAFFNHSVLFKDDTQFILVGNCCKIATG